MTEDEARKVELVRAIENEDRDAALLTREDREQATAFARSRAAQAAPADELDFVADRAAFAASRLTTRHPAVSALLERSRWPRWIGLAVPLIALLAGLLANEFGTDKRLDLLAAPLLGTIGWNLLVYLWLIVTVFVGEGRAIDRLAAALTRMAGAGARGMDNGPLQRATSAFQRDWARMALPLTRARLARTLHLGAAMFAVGLIAGIYFRALGVEYRAGWESTFLSPAAVRAVLAMVLGPASLVTGVVIPPIDTIAVMRWTGPASGGVNAGPWIHLYTATVVGLVIIPRIVLSLWQAAKAARLARRFPAHGREDFYVRRQLRAAKVRAGAARVTPYAYHPDAATRARLTDALRGALGENAVVRMDEPVEYGAEDTWLASQSFDPDTDYHLLLFTASATPEAENHGVLAAGLARRLAADGHGAIPAAFIDEGPFRSRFAGQADTDQRLAGRIGAWRTAIAQSDAAVLALDLSREPDAALIERIEGALSSDGALRG